MADYDRRDDRRDRDPYYDNRSGHGSRPMNGGGYGPTHEEMREHEMYENRRRQNELDAYRRPPGGPGGQYGGGGGPQGDRYGGPPPGQGYGPGPGPYGDQQRSRSFNQGFEHPPPPPPPAKKSKEINDFKGMFNKDGSLKKQDSKQLPPPQHQQGPPPVYGGYNQNNDRHNQNNDPYGQKAGYNDPYGAPPPQPYNSRQAGGPPPQFAQEAQKPGDERRTSLQATGAVMVMEGEDEEESDDGGGGGHIFLHSDDMVGVSFSFAQKVCGAGAVFFMVERSSVPGHWRHSMTIAGLVCGVAFWNYIYMKDAWVQSKQCPRIYRYMDWVVTVPMQVIEIWMILYAVGGASAFLFVRLMAAAIGMLIWGYCGESTRVDWCNVWAGFALGMACWIYIIFEVTFGEAEGTRMKHDNEAANMAFIFLRIILIFGWALYPAGYVLGQTFNVPVALMRLNISYNTADLVNKVAFGLSIYVAAMHETDHRRELEGQFHVHH